MLDSLTGAPKIDIFFKENETFWWILVLEVGDGSDGLCGHCGCCELFPGGLRHEKMF